MSDTEDYVPTRELESSEPVVADETRLLKRPRDEVETNETSNEILGEPESESTKKANDSAADVKTDDASVDAAPAEYKDVVETQDTVTHANAKTTNRTTFSVTSVAIPAHKLASESLQTRLAALAEDRGGLIDSGGMSGADESVRLIARGHSHGFIAAVTAAFKDHYPLSLRPQHIWLLILQGVAEHIDNNSEELRPLWVKHQGKKELIVERDGFVLGAENDWAGVIHEFSAQIGSNVHEEVDELLNLPFSSSTSDEIIAAKVTAMDICKNYFEYTVRTMCGFPSIELQGTLADWQSLRIHALRVVSERCGEDFSNFWLPSLLPLLDKFVDQYEAASQGQNHLIDTNFWNSMCKQGGTEGSGSYTWFNGWINIFFPYIKKRRNVFAVPYSPIKAYVLEGLKWDTRYKRFNGSQEIPFGPDIEFFPPGRASVPVKWSYLGQTIPLTFMAGFVGASQDPKTLVITPHIGWSVMKESKKEEATGCGAGGGYSLSNHYYDHDE